MVSAFQHDRYASGFALARPTLEALLKQVQLTAYSSDDDGWKKIIDRKVEVTPKALRELATKEGWPDLSRRWASLQPVLNDFVHGGVGQLRGNPLDERGWPTYPADWFWTTMFVATFSMVSTSCWFWAHIGVEERAKAALDDFTVEDWRIATTMRNSQTIRVVGPEDDLT